MAIGHYQKSAPERLGVELNSVHGDVHRLLEKMYNELDRQTLNREYLRDLTDQLSTQTVASAIPIPVTDEFQALMLEWGFTRTEAKVFQAMASKLGKVFTGDSIFEAVWSDRVYCPETKLLDVYMCKVRKKLLKKDLPYWIENIWGVGYRLVRHTPGAVRQMTHKA